MILTTQQLSQAYSSPYLIVQLFLLRPSLLRSVFPFFHTLFINERSLLIYLQHKISIHSLFFLHHSTYLILKISWFRKRLIDCSVYIILPLRHAGSKTNVERISRMHCNSDDDEQTLEKEMDFFYYNSSLCQRQQLISCKHPIYVSELTVSDQDV